MPGPNTDPSVFTRLVDRLDLEHVELFGVDRDGVPESLPRVTLFRSADLLSLRLSFVGLTLTDGVLHRADPVRPGLLRVLFGGQHVVEEALFEISDGITVARPSADGRPPDRDAGAVNGDPLVPPPVRARISAGSRLVFSVTDQQIPFTTEGLLAALTRLPLSTVAHAARSPFVLGPLVGRNELEALGVGAADRARIAGSWHTVTTTLAAAARMQARFGTTAAATTLLAAARGEGTFVLQDSALERLGAVLGRASRDLAALPPVPREPGPTETAIELPWRLLLSPHAGGGFRHGTAPAAGADGRTELWHTRLGSWTENGTVETDRDDRTVRAVWARDFDETPGFTFHDRPPGGAVQEFPAADQSQDLPRWRSALNSRDRMMLVHETSNFRLPRVQGRRYVPPSVEVDTLMLSSLGGWLSSDVRTTPPSGTSTTIEEWVHRATFGRDHYVKVVYAGFLLPFGHRASLVKVTERKIKQGRAYLFQRMYVVVRQPVRTFPAADVAEPIRRGMPFTTVRILTPATPDLNPPDDLTVPTPAGYLFTPVVGGEPFRFRLLGVDLVGRTVEFDGPLVFAEFDHNLDATTVEQTRVAYGPAAPSLSFRGQKVAYAPSAVPDDTSLATNSMIFDVVSDATLLLRDQAVAKLEPTLRTASVVVPAMSTLAGNADPVTVALPAAYRSAGFGGNAAEVFLQLTSGKPLDFTTRADRSGGFVAPSMTVTGLSRTLGPVGGDVGQLVSGGGGFDPAVFFGGLGKLFGLVSLGELLPKGFRADRLPRFVAQSFDPVTMLAANLEQLAGAAGRLATAPEAAGAAANLRAADTAARALLDAIADLAEDDGVPLPTKITTAAAAVPALRTALTAVGPALSAAGDVLRSERESLSATVARVADQVGSTDAELTALTTALQLVAGGGQLPETVRARLDFTADLLPWGPGGVGNIFVPTPGPGRLTLAVDVQAPTRPGAEPSALISCAISPFELRLIGDTTFLVLAFAKLEFSAVPGRKTDVNVVFASPNGVRFAGPLSFVETLREIIPLDGFSDPPHLEVSPSGIRAGFELPIPTLAMGIFALSNLTFSAAFEVPFVGESIAVRFAFSSREDPFRLQVAFFAGGGFFAVVITPQEVRQLEAALEFGAAVALDFGVASGSVSVMAGIYFCLKTVDGRTNAKLTGYFRARGEVDVLGLITASIEIYLELSYETASGKAVGRASISVEVSVCLLSFSVSISCEKKFAGSAGDPTFTDVMGEHPLAVGAGRPWDAYCDAFAG